MERKIKYNPEDYYDELHAVREAIKHLNKGEKSFVLSRSRALLLQSRRASKARKKTMANVRKFLDNSAKAGHIS